MSLIAISAGHHPAKPGASFEHFTEHEEAVIWREYLCKELDDIGLNVPTGFLRQKVDFIKQHAVSIAVEIHFNSALNNDGQHVGRGSETLYYPTSDLGRRVAGTIQAHLSPLFGPDRGAKVGWYRMRPENGPDYFLQRTPCPAVIIEPEFVQNYQKIKTDRIKGCEAIAAALKEALEALTHG